MLLRLTPLHRMLTSLTCLTSLRRSLSGVISLLLISVVSVAHADDKLVLGTNWFAEAEHGGFYQALATGIYKKYKLDVTIKMGGPSVNGIQLLAGGAIDVWMGYDFQTLKALEQGVPVVTIAGFFQKDPQALLAHPDVKTWEDLKGHPLYIASGSDTSFWPWLKARYGYTDNQKKPYAFSVAPFLADPSSAQQGYITSEPFAMEQGGVKPTALLMADAGYPPYATTMVTMQKTSAEHADMLARFVRASAEGWVSYLKDPAAGNALIKRDDPKMTDAQLAYGIAQLKKYGLVTGGDAASKGIGIMTDARWKQTYDVMVSSKLLAANVDYHQAYTLQYVKALPLPASP